MGLKILHTADWHLDSPFARFSPEQQEFLMGEQRRIPGRIADLVRKENCDLVLISGDIFDGTASRKSVALVRDALKACCVPVVITPGNHDYLTPGSPWLEEKWPENVHVFTGGLNSMVLPQLNCRIYGAGYRAPECPGLLENFKREGPERYHVAVLHGDPMRLSSPYCPITAAQVRDSGLTYLALGHIHKAGSFRTPNTLCGWPGVPMGRGYDETREKGVYIVTLEERAELRFVPLDTPRFYEIEVDTDIQELENVLPPADNDSFYRVTLTGSGGEPLWKLKEYYRGMTNLEWIDNRTQKTDMWHRAGEDTLEGAYFRLLREKLEQAAGDREDLTEEARKVHLAAEISHKILEGREVVL
jgi:DNA repair exonuclease SbcCD nuclease subunit